MKETISIVTTPDPRLRQKSAKVTKIDDEVHEIIRKMVKASLVSAIQQVNLDLTEVVERHKTNGILSVADISSETVGGENYAQTLYKKAVFARAKHELLPEFNTLSAREVHENRQYVEEQKSLLAEATHAIRVLKGKRRGSVCLV